MTLKRALAYVGGLTSTTKMPCPSYDLPAKRCHIGSILRNVADSVCACCYALKGFYAKYACVEKANERRYASIVKPYWCEAMAFILNKRGYKLWRWHSSGDLQSVWHLRRIVAVCNMTPNIRHWLPTREYLIVSKFIDEGGVIPDNLIVRLSAYIVDGPLPVGIADKLGVLMSGVSAKGDHTCPASEQDNSCGNCRLCWNKETKTVIYKKH